MGMPDDFKRIVQGTYEIVGSQKEQEESKFENSFEESKQDLYFHDGLVRIDFRSFMKAVVRPFVYQTAKDYTAIKIIDVLMLIHQKLTILATINRQSLTYFYQSQNESELNDFGVFSEVFIQLFNSQAPDEAKLEIPIDFPQGLFNKTFSSVSTFFEKLSDQAQNKLDEVYPKKVLVPVHKGKSTTEIHN